MQASYMARRGHEVHVYEGRSGTPASCRTGTRNERKRPPVRCPLYLVTRLRIHAVIFLVPKTSAMSRATWVSVSTLLCRHVASARSLALAWMQRYDSLLLSDASTKHPSRSLSSPSLSTSVCFVRQPTLSSLALLSTLSRFSTRVC